MNALPVLLLAAFEWLMPSLIPRTVPFGVRIPGARAAEPVVTRQRRIYRYGIVAVSAAAVAAALLAGPLPGIVVEIAGAFAFFQVARLTIRSAKRRENWYGGLRQVVVADTSLRAERRPYPWLWALPSIAVTTATVILGVVRYPHLHGQVATHYDIAGRPDRHAAVSPFSIFGPVVVQVLLTAMLLGLAATALRGTARLDAEDPQAAAERQRRFRVIETRSLLGLAALFSVVFLLDGLSRFQIADLAWARVLLPIGLVAVLAFLLWAGQNGSRLRVQGQAADGRTTNEDDDRYWWFGMFYANRDDPSLIVPKRFGIGRTVNLGHPLAWVLLVATLAIPLILQ